ncbi:MAG TPA: glycogen synthase [Roseiflexaceae bacterium]|nr:glycogen synthase [Roseiflexaceae bacterium]
MNVLFVAAEVAPLIKVGGLADVAGALPATLGSMGHDVRIVMPRYRQLRERGVPHVGPICAGFLPIGERQEEMRAWNTSIGDTPVYMLDIPAAFERPSIYGDSDDDRRFILFARGVLALMQHLREVEGWSPDVVHANDWHTALVVNYLKTYYAYTFGHIGTVFTIHNLAYQGAFNPFTLHLAGLSESGLVEERAGPDFRSQFNFMARGLIYADLISTVSPTYAEEIMGPEYGERLDELLRSRRERVAGILNGIDTKVFNPATDPHIAANYTADDPDGKAPCKTALQQALGLEVGHERPLIGIVSRLAEQKGFDLIEQILPWLLDETDAQLVILGSGHPHFEGVFSYQARANPARMGVRLGFDAALAQQIYAGSDMFLMPSRFEPCGLGQMIALRYGSVPVVRATGGLNDTIREGYDGNGFRFHPYEARYLQDALGRALTAYRDAKDWAILRERGMREDNSWAHSAQSYVGLYQWAQQLANGG